MRVVEMLLPQMITLRIEAEVDARCTALRISVMGKNAWMTVNAIVAAVVTSSLSPFVGAYRLLMMHYALVSLSRL